MPQLAALVDSGQVRVEFKHFPLNNTKSIWAVEAVECAGDQGMWYAMHSQLFENQSKGLTTDITKRYAADLGLDTKAFNQCVDSDKYVTKAKEAQAAAQKLGLTGTPAFRLNGQNLDLSTLKSWDDVATRVKEAVNKP